MPEERVSQPRSLVLPAVTMSLSCLGQLVRLTRATMREVLRQDYIQVARAKGLTSFAISYRHALRKAGDRARGAAMASDGFIHLPEFIERAAQAGVTAVIQPGGSEQDAAVIAAADRLGLAMAFTGTRHFSH